MIGRAGSHPQVFGFRGLCSAVHWVQGNYKRAFGEEQSSGFLCMIGTPPWRLSSFVSPGRLKLSRSSLSFQGLLCAWHRTGPCKCLLNERVLESFCALWCYVEKHAFFFFFFFLQHYGWSIRLRKHSLKCKVLIPPKKSQSDRGQSLMLSPVCSGEKEGPRESGG